MTPEQKRIAIAEACGWRDVRGLLHPNGMLYRKDSAWLDCKGEFQRFIPDYLNDLNACADMRKILVGDQQVEYAYQLKEICCPITGEDWAAIDATAEQHCEAFGLTLGLWK